MMNKGKGARASTCKLAGALAALGTAAAVHGQTVLYVDDDAPVGGNGQSWSEAFQDLQDALWTASFTWDSVEIRIAQGTYRPDRGSGIKDASFRVDNIGSVSSGVALSFGISLKGAFAGIKALDPNERDTHKFKTLLSGDLNGDDLPGFVNYEDNSHHIFQADVLTYSSIELDGLTFQGGNGQGSYNRRADGGAVQVYIEEPTLVTVSVVDCVFLDNKAFLGGAVYFNGPGIQCTISHCFFGNNFARDAGSAIFSETSQTTFAVNSVFSNNTSDYRGGAIYNRRKLEVLESTFFGNAAQSHGAIGGALGSNAKVANSVLFSNGQDAVSTNNSVEISFSCIEGGFTGNGNLDVDPLFTNPLGPDGILGTPDDLFLPRFGSPVIDAGKNILVVHSFGLDYAGQPRIVDDRFTPDTGSGSAPIVDMGAYEFQSPACYADLDHSTGIGILDIFDFLRFQQLYVMNDSLACQVDRSTGNNICDIFDFLAFQSEFSAGCP